MAGSGKSVLAKVKALLSKAKVAFVSGPNGAAPNPAAPAPTATPTATTAALTNAPTASSSSTPSPSSSASPSPPQCPASPPTPAAASGMAAAAEHSQNIMFTQTGVLPPGSGGLPPSPQNTLQTIAAGTSAPVATREGPALTSPAPRTTWAAPNAKAAPMHRVFTPPYPRPSPIAQQALTHTTATGPTAEDTYVDDTPAGQPRQHQGPVVTIKQQPLQVSKANAEPTVSKALPQQRETALMALLRDVIAGSCTGVATTVVGHPLDTVKTRLQAQSGSHRMYAGTIDCIRQTFRNEGLAGFYKGAASPLCMYLLYCSVYYSSYVQARRLFGIPDRSKPAPMHLILASTAVTGLCTTFVRTPMDLLKTKAQTVHFSEASLAGAGAAAPTATASSAASSGSSAKYQGTLRLGVHMVRQHGPLSLFQGFAPTLLRQVVGAFTWFFPYEFLKQRAGEGPASVFLCGGLASWVYWASVYPIDSVKTRIQSDSADPKTRRYRGWVDCFRVTLRMEGTRALFNGFTACMLRAFPANAAGILAYEYARKFVDEHV